MLSKYMRIIPHENKTTSKRHLYLHAVICCFNTALFRFISTPPNQTLMGTPNKWLEHAVLSLPFHWNSSTLQGEYPFEYLADEVFPWVIGCTVLVKILLAVVYLIRRRELTQFPRPRTWLASIRIYIGTAFDVLVCFGSLLRINVSYLYLAIVPFIVVLFICVLRMKNNQLSGQEGNPEAGVHQNTVMLSPEACSDVKTGSTSRSGTDDGKKKMKAKGGKRNNQLTGTGDVKSGSSTTGTDDGKKKMIAWKNTNGKKSPEMPENFNIVVHLNNGLNTRVMTEEFKVVVLLAPHIILSVSGMVGDPDHDGNNYDISNLFLFLTCMLQELTFIMISSELLCKASLVVLLLTAHILAVNVFGEKVVLLLLPEVVPPLMWISLHLDRRTPVINVQKILGTEHIVFMPVLVAMCGYIAVIPTGQLWFYWAATSCLTSAVMIYILLLVLQLWPAKVSIATLSSAQVLDLLMFWGKVLLNVAAALFVLRLAVWLKSTLGP